jgi:hypothetical protein
MRNACLAVGGLFISIVLAPAELRSAQPTTRTVYVTIMDDKNVGLADLTPADFVVKEGGKEREIVKVERASAKMRISLAVEELLTADTQVRVGLFDFMKRTIGNAEIRLVTIGLRNTTVVDYTTNLDALGAALNKFALNPAKESAVAESVLQMSREFAEEKPERPVIVVVCATGVNVENPAADRQRARVAVRDHLHAAGWREAGSSLWPDGEAARSLGPRAIGNF